MGAGGAVGSPDGHARAEPAHPGYPAELRRGGRDAPFELTVDEDLAADRLTITVEDNGRGIPPEKLPKLFDPFYTTRSTRHVGLGLPLLKAAAERCNGDVTLASEVGVGATLTATFQHSHLDRAPLGDLTGTLRDVHPGWGV